MQPVDLIYRAAARLPDAVAVEAPGISLGHGELVARADALAVALQAMDPEPQSRVGVCAYNNVEHLIALLAVMAADKIWVPLNPLDAWRDLGIKIAAARPSLLIADEYRRARKPIPGFGHHMHKPDDPRTPKLFALAESEGLPGHHIAALRTLSAAVDQRFGKHITINATGAVGALLGEIAIPAPIMRGIAVISRSAGLVAHIAEEQRTPSMRYIWELVEEGVPYDAEPDTGD